MHKKNETRLRRRKTSPSPIIFEMSSSLPAALLALVRRQPVFRPFNHGQRLWLHHR